MPLRHNPQIGRGLIKFTFRSGDRSIKTSFFARRVNEYISSDDNGTFITNNGTFTYGDIVNQLWNAEARGERNNNFIINLYRQVFGCEPITDEARTQTVDHMGDSLQSVRGTFEIHPQAEPIIISADDDVVDHSEENLPETFDDVINSSAEAIADAVREEHTRTRTRTRSVRRHRNLNVGYYHQNGSGCNRRGLREALEAIPFDEDGVRRSFGVEYEIYSMNDSDRSDLCYVLDELPPCYVENDGSLGSGGVELVFNPVGKEDYIRIVKTLKEFVDSHNIYMFDRGTGSGAGMHTTYGVSNSHARDTDTIRVEGYTVPLIQARLNRVSALLKVTCTRDQIRNIFGRYFTGYAISSFDQGSGYLRTNIHSNSMSINGRVPVDGIYTCWEFRLPTYNCDVEKVVEFFKATEWVFHRTMHVEDATAMLRSILPSNTVED